MKPLTSKQRKLMTVVMKGNIDVKGDWISWCDYQQILDRLPYETSRESLMCSIRILRNQGWIERGGKELRIGRVRQTITPTPLAGRILNPVKPSSVVTYEEVIGDEFIELNLI
jgi:hypothetical protein